VRPLVSKISLRTYSFNSRTPGGVRHHRSSNQGPRQGFNSRTPGGVRHEPHPRPPRLAVSIHAPREGCDLRIVDRQESIDVSIHAPREGCDPYAVVLSRLWDVSIHAPREGCDNTTAGSQPDRQGFNSRTPGGVRRICKGLRLRLALVSIHAPREGCDRLSIHVPLGVEFQFTHPGRGATPPF